MSVFVYIRIAPWVYQVCSTQKLSQTRGRHGCSPRRCPLATAHRPPTSRSVISTVHYDFKGVIPTVIQSWSAPALVNRLSKGNVARISMLPAVSRGVLIAIRSDQQPRLDIGRLPTASKGCTDCRHAINWSQLRKRRDSGWTYVIAGVHCRFWAQKSVRNNRGYVIIIIIIILYYANKGSRQIQWTQYAKIQNIIEI